MYFFLDGLWTDWFCIAVTDVLQSNLKDGRFVLAAAFSDVRWSRAGRVGQSRSCQGRQEVGVVVRGPQVPVLSKAPSPQFLLQEPTSKLPRIALPGGDHGFKP